MYQNIGKKIMMLAQIIGWLFLVAGVIVFIASFPDKYDGPEVYGWIALGVGVLSFISSWFLYGFGQLVDDVSVIRNAPKEAPKDTVSDELPEL